MYKHTQTGWFIIVPLAASLALLTILYFQVHPYEIIWVMRGVIILIVLCLFLFYNLTVIVGGGYLEARMGIGLVKKIIRLSDIATCEPARNKWWYGWGIRYVIGLGFMLNVSGLDAVQIALKNGKRFRIGTDEPGKLVEAINRGRSS